MALAAGATRRYCWAARRALIHAGVMSPPANLLRNADFSLMTNPPVPDYWGTDAVWRDSASLECLSVDDRTRLGEAHSLCVCNDRGESGVTVYAHPTFVPRPSPYTLSCYVKADAAGRNLTLLFGWGAARTFAATREWQRVAVTYEPRAEADARRGLEAKFSVAGPGTWWIAAPQLEVGSAPTPFVTALADDHPLPESPWNRDEQWVPSPAQFDHDLMTAIAADHPTTEQLREIANHGFDAVVLFVPATGPRGEFADETEQAASRLDAAAACGLRVIAFLAHRAAGTPAELTASVVRTIRALKTHASILAWVVLDEPSRLWRQPDWTQIAALHAAARAEDPHRLVLVNDNTWTGDPAERLSATDVGSADIYPVGRYVNSVAPLADLSARVNRACTHAGKPAALWLQLYGYDDAVREPTPYEARAMSYVTFIHGSRFLFYWKYKPMNRRLWTATADVCRELRRLETAFSRDTARCVGVGTRTGRVHYAIWDIGSRAAVVACNVSPDPVVVNLAVNGAGSARRVEAAWYEGVRHLHVGRRLWARFPAYGRQVWELA